MSLYTLTEISEQLEKLKLESPQYITLIIQMKKYLDLKNSINFEFAKLYPTIEEKSLTAKIFAIQHPEISIICPYTNTKKKYNYAMKKYVCPNTCQCTKDYTIQRNIEKYGVSSTNKLSSVKENKKLSYIKKFGVDNPSKVKKIQEKKKETSIKNWGCEFPLQSEEIKEKGRKTNLKILGVEYGMQDPIIREKARKTNLKVRGVEYPSQDKLVKDKIKHTNLINWGYEYSSQAEEIKQKIVNTCLKNNGCNYPMQSEEIKEKSRKTNLENCGYEYNLQSPEGKEKYTSTMIERYGVKTPMESKELQDKAKQVCLERYGFDHVWKSPEIREKIAKTMVSKYGVVNAMQSEAIKEKVKKSNLLRNESSVKFINQRKIDTCNERYGVDFASQKHISKESMNIMENKELFSEMLSNNSVKGMAKKLGISYFMISTYHKKYDLKIIKPCGTSSYERELSSFFNENNIEFITKDRNQIKPYEIDFYFPKLQLGIEFHGDYWHMHPSLFEADDIHPVTGELAWKKWEHDNLKHEMCNEREIYLLTIWEHEWEDNKDEIKQNLLALFKSKDI
jgi:hypothetical protein